MASKCEAWRSAIDGTLHGTERAATTYDVEQFCRKKLVRPDREESTLPAALVANADEAIKLLQAYVKCHPQAAIGARAAAPQNGSKGPEKDPADPPAETHGDMS